MQQNHCKNHKIRQMRERGSLLKKEFRVMIVKMMQILEIKWRQGSRQFKKCLTNTHKKQTRQPTMNNTMTEIKNTLERTNSRNRAVEWISELEDRMVEMIEAKQNEEQE